jgi:hypothetical protein
MNHKVQRAVSSCEKGEIGRFLSTTAWAWSRSVIARSISKPASDARASASTSARQSGDGLSTVIFGSEISSNLRCSLQLPETLERISTSAALAFLLLPNLKIL